MWRERIDLAGVLQRAAEKYDLTDVEAACPEEIKREIAECLRGSQWLAHFAQDVLWAETVEDVNGVLMRVYNAADRHRVWCGMAV